MYVCMYVYIYIKYIYIYIYIYSRMFGEVVSILVAYVLDLCSLPHTHTHTHTHTHISNYAYIHTYIHTHIHTCTPTYRHAHIHTYIYLFICLFVCLFTYRKCCHQQTCLPKFILRYTCIASKSCGRQHSVKCRLLYSHQRQPAVHLVGSEPRTTIFHS